MSVPVVFQYQRALDEFRREGREPPLLKRMSELISLLDLTTTLSSGLTSEEILDAALLIIMGELQGSRGVLLVREEGDRYAVRASRGLPPGAPTTLSFEAPAQDDVVLRASGRFADLCAALGLDVLCPVYRGGRAIAVLALGPRADRRAYGDDEAGFLRSVAACASTPIENGLIYDELRRLNQKLSLKVFELRNLFEISRELTTTLDDESIKNLVTTRLMGHLMVSRCALYLDGPGGLALAHERGLRSDAESALVPEAAARVVLDGLHGAATVAELPQGALRERLERTRMALVVPLSLGGRALGLLAVGERVAGGAFGEEDRDFAFTLARQAMAALESTRLHRIRLEKERQDRELEIARGIQQSLFPSTCPALPGFDVAAASQACYQVGGDHYDFIPLADGRVALTVADVSGKGTPASILMASVHASLRALAGGAPPAILMERLNAFLFASTQANRYVTLFYGEVDPAARRFTYVNAGHVPPFCVAADRTTHRLTVGGPVLGLIEGVSFETGEVHLDPGDLVAMVTDGATEALSPSEEEFGDERIAEALRGLTGASAEGVVRGVLEAVESWTSSAGCSDDLTVLILRAL